MINSIRNLFVEFKKPFPSVGSLPYRLACWRYDFEFFIQQIKLWLKGNKDGDN